VSWIEIKMTKCVLVITEAELQKLLSRDPALWAEAIKRGKGTRRVRAARERAEKQNTD